MNLNSQGKNKVFPTLTASNRGSALRQVVFTLYDGHNREKSVMTNKNPIGELFNHVEEQGWWCAYLTDLLYSTGGLIEKQKQVLHMDLPLQIYLSLDDESRLQNIKAAIKKYPDLRPEVAKILGNLTSDKLFKNLRNDKSEILKRVINELNNSVTNME